MKNIDILLKKLRNTITEEEDLLFQEWLKKSASNGKLYEKLVLLKKEGINIQEISKIDIEAAWKKVQQKAGLKQKTILLYNKTWFKYAAAILVLAFATTYFLKDTIFKTAPVVVNNQIQPGSDKATLTLETGETIALVKGASIQTQNASSNGEQIVYEVGSPKTEDRSIAYNYLTIPRGGQFQLTLADGTKVWLNSETRLKYPVSFVDGESRQVELVYGEAYFDVSPSTAHKGADFKVLNNNQEVEVLGTEFNIKAYKDETHVYTTLVEGKVAVNYKDTKKILKPNEQSNVNLTDNTLKVTAIDVYNETSWKEGIFSFKEMPLKDIAKVLSRWYDVTITFSTPTLEQKMFNGVLNKKQTLEEILFIIKKTNKINDYEIVNKQIIIT